MKLSVFLLTLAVSMGAVGQTFTSQSDEGKVGIGRCMITTDEGSRPCTEKEENYKAVTGEGPNVLIWQHGKQVSSDAVWPYHCDDPRTHCEQQSWPAIDVTPQYQHCGYGSVERDVYGCWINATACTKSEKACTAVTGVVSLTPQQKQPTSDEGGPYDWCGGVLGCDDEGYKHVWRFSTNEDFLDVPIGVMPEAVSVETSETTVVKLSDEEYANLQKLRQAVVDEEKRLAVKYGAVQEVCTYGSGTLTDAIRGVNPQCNKPDHYEFHRNFLLIDKTPTGISGGLSPEVEEWMRKHSFSDSNSLIINRFPDGSVLKGSAR